MLCEQRLLLEMVRPRARVVRACKQLACGLEGWNVLHPTRAEVGQVLKSCTLNQWHCEGA